MTASPHSGSGPTEHARLGDGRVCQQDRLDLARHHVLAAADDRVHLATEHDQPPALVEAAEVAGVQHAAARDARSLDQDLAVRGDRDRKARQRAARRLDVSGLRDRHRGARLREPVGRRDRPARVPCTREQRRVRRRAAEHHDPQRRRRRAIDQPRELRRNQRRDRHVVTSRRPDHRGRAVDHRAQQHHQPAHVAQRQRAQPPLRARVAERHRTGESVVKHVPAREHDRPRHARRARRMNDERGVGGRGGRQRRSRRRPRLPHLPAVLQRLDHLPGPGKAPRPARADRRARHTPPQAGTRAARRRNRDPAARARATRSDEMRKRPGTRRATRRTSRRRRAPRSPPCRAAATRRARARTPRRRD